MTFLIVERCIQPHFELGFMILTKDIFRGDKKTVNCDIFDKNATSRLTFGLICDIITRI